MIRFFCKNCGKRFKVNDQLSGKRGRCPCGNRIEIPTISHKPLISDSSTLLQSLEISTQEPEGNSFRSRNLEQRRTPTMSNKTCSIIMVMVVALSVFLPLWMIHIRPKQNREVSSPQYRQQSIYSTTEGASPGIPLVVTFILFMFGINMLVSLLIVPFAIWKIFKKVGEKGWAVLIPSYNQLVYLRAAGRPVWWIVAGWFYPLIIIIGIIFATNAIASNFGKGLRFKIGLLLLPFIFFPILASGNTCHINHNEGGRSNSGLATVGIVLGGIISQGLITLSIPLVFPPDNLKMARTGITMAKMAVIEEALYRYEIDNGNIPSSAEGLNALLEKPASARKWRGPYLLKRQLSDYWKHEYQYKRPGIGKEKYEVSSLGKDGIVSEDDIVSD